MSEKRNATIDCAVANHKPTALVETIKTSFASYTPEICAERAQLVTKSYKETEALPTVLRRAKAFEKILAEMSIFIQDGELIVGNQCSKPRSTPIFPEFSCQWLADELDRLAQRKSDVFLVSEATKSVLRNDVFPYWQGKTNQEYATSLMTQEALVQQDAGVFTVGNYYFNGVGHISVDYKKVLECGLEGIIAEAKEEMTTLNIADSADMQKRLFLEAVIISNQAVINFAKRFAVEARQLAASADAERKTQLLEIARICETVPAKPATGFHEALQSFWFIQLTLQIESNGHSISPMRMDQYLLPYYEADKAKLGAENVQQLVDLLWIKMAEINKVRDEGSTEAFGGYPMFQNIIVGGVDIYGEDATNELSLIMLQASANTALYAPSISVRIHEGTPQLFWEKAAEVTRLGLGMPAFYSDRIIVPALLSRGLSLEDARDYGIIGCVEPQVAGKTEGWHDAAFFNMAKVFELALNNGFDPLGKKQIGPQTGTVEDFNSFEDVMNAYQKQMEFSVELLCHSDNAVDLAHAKNIPLPFLSGMVEDCIGRGKSVQEGGAIYNFTGPQGVGVANVGDSLAAIKKFCFDSQDISLPELKKAMDEDYVGQEALRQMLLKRGPKYGNDDDYVDEIAVRATNIYCTEVQKYSNPRNGKFQPGLYPVSANVPLGSIVAATPDGRKSGQPLADGVSPQGGFDASGPTAAVNSVAKLDHAVASNGTLLNQKFHPSAVKGEEGLQNLIAVTDTYFKNGGLHVQYNVADRKTLIDAKEHPEDYSSLVVRVAGYSAFFTALSSSIQDDIISRTEQNF